MSVIAGSWHFDGHPEGGPDCRRMLQAQRHYEQGDAEVWDGDRIALGRVLEPLLPEDKFDRGPVASDDGRFRLVADCRLDNREELTHALGINSAAAAAMADAELLLRVWQRWETAATERITGDFAFAVWDGVERTLTLARDALAARPLYYHSSSAGFAFASMPAGLHGLERVPYGLDEQRIVEGLAFLVTPMRRTWFRDIQQLLPGEMLIVKPDGVRVERFWRPEEIAYRSGSREQHAEAIRDALDRAVRAQMRGAGTVGSQLSGGLDSSAVTTAAARTLEGSGRRLVVFTGAPHEGFQGMGPANRTLDETQLAAETMRMLPEAEHVIVRPGLEATPLRHAKPYARLFGRPATGACNMPWGELMYATTAERGVRVMLTGVPGNATISYNGLDVLPSLVRRGRWLRAGMEAKALVARGVLGPKYAVWQLGRALLPERAERWMEQWSAKPTTFQTLRLLNPQAGRVFNIEERLHATSKRMEQRRDAVRLSILEMLYETGPIHKGIKAAWGIDLRNPTADKKLVELCLSIPPEDFLENGEPAAIYKRAFRERLPAAVLSSRRRGVQGADWFERLERARPLLLEDIAAFERSPTASALMDLEAMRRMVENWPAGGWDRQDVILAYRGVLLTAVALGQFILNAEAGRPRVT